MFLSCSLSKLQYCIIEAFAERQATLHHELPVHGIKSSQMNISKYHMMRFGEQGPVTSKGKPGSVTCCTDTVPNCTQYLPLGLHLAILSMNYRLWHHPALWPTISGSDPLFQINVHCPVVDQLSVFLVLHPNHVFQIVGRDVDPYHFTRIASESIEDKDWPHREESHP